MFGFFLMINVFTFSKSDQNSASIFRNMSQGGIFLPSSTLNISQFKSHSESIQRTAVNGNFPKHSENRAYGRTSGVRLSTTKGNKQDKRKLGAHSGVGSRNHENTISLSVLREAAQEGKTFLELFDETEKKLFRKGKFDPVN